MQSSKHLAVMFLFGATAVGGALGFTADRVMIRDRICATSSPPNMRAELADRLHLTEAQRSKVDSILDDRHRQIQMIMATVKDPMDSVRMRSRDQIRAILNPQQRENFETLLTELNTPNKSREDH